MSFISFDFSPLLFTMMEVVRTYPFGVESR